MANKNKIQQQLVKELGIDKFPKDKQEELLVKMTEVLLKRIFIETMEKLTDQARVEYEKLAEGGAKAQQIEEFLQKNIHDYEGMIEKVIDKFKEEMKNGTNN